MTQFGTKLISLAHGRVGFRSASGTVSRERALVPTRLHASALRKGQRLMIQEGSVWSVMNTLSIPAGIVTTGFALYLKADAFVIGLMSALPLLSALLQLWTPQLVALFGSRKLVCMFSLGAARALLVPLAGVGMGAALRPDLAALWLTLFLGLMTLSAALTAVGGTAWLSWATTMVPAEKRAVYFARRTAIMNFIGLGVALLAGFGMDRWADSTPSGRQTNPFVYTVLFGLAAVAGIVTIFLIKATPDLRLAGNLARPRFRDSLMRTWQMVPLRRYLIFRSAWQFAVGLVAPYYTVYMLQNLKLGFTEIFVLQNIGALAGLLALPWWGKVLERIGCSRVLFWTSLFKVAYIVAWAFIIPGAPFLPLVLVHLTLVVDAGLTLASGNLLMNLMPDHHLDNVGYFSVFTAITSVVSAVGPFTAGFLVSVVAAGQFQSLGLTFGSIQLIFLLSGLFRLLSLGLFRGFSDKRAAC